MLELKGIDLKNVVLFEDVSFSVNDNGGLVVINGLNLDSHEPENTNGAGKSLLWSGLPNALFEATPLSAKKTNKKDMLDDKKSSITLRYNGVNDLEYVYTQMASKYVVEEEGKDLGIGKQEVAKKKLNATFPMTQEEFYSTCYIQNLKPLMFQHSTDTDRLKFLTDMFDLHIFDHIRKEVHNKLKSIKDAEIEFKTLSAQLDEVLRNQTKLEENQVDKKALAKLQDKAETLKKAVKKLLKRQQKLEDLRDKVEKAAKLEKERDKLRKKLPKTKGLQDKNKALIKQIDRYEAYEEAYSEYKKAASDTVKKLEKLEKALGKNVSADLDDIRNKYESADTELDKLKDQVSDIEDLEDYISTTESGIAKLQKRLAKMEVDTSKTFDKDDLSMYRQTIAMYDKLSRHDHGDDCPTCGSKLDIKALKKTAKKAQEKLDAYSMIKEAVDIEEEIESYQEDLAKFIKQRKKLPKLKALKKLIQTLETKVEEYGELGVTLKTYLQEKKVSDGLTKPKKVDKPDTKLDVEELEEQLEWLQRLEVVEGKLEGLSFDDELNSTELESTLTQIAKDIESKTDSLDDIQTKITSEKINKAELKSVTKQASKLQKKLSKVESVVAERKLFEYLYKKYNANDLKLKAASSIMGIIETSLNTYSSLVFVEKTDFRLRPSKQGVMAQYKTSKNGKWADIRSLSGAETNCFRLLFAISLIPLIPEHRRTNFIVLDEPDAACSDVTRQRLIKDFLPKLRAIVPHVFWVTPKESDSFKEAEVWTVVKENGVSRLEIG